MANTERSDRSTNATVPKNTPFRALRAYDLFRKWITEFAASGPSDNEPDTEGGGIEAENNGATQELIEERLESLLRAVLAQMKQVVITLDSWGRR
jgi:hypothetical protein